MNRSVLLFFIGICGLASIAFAQSKILKIATAGFVDNAKADQAVSTTDVHALLCKGDASITCSCDQRGKTRPFFRWDNMNTIFQPYANVKLDYVTLILSHSCSEGGANLWNGAQLFYTTTYWDRSTITWNNQPQLTFYKNLTTSAQGEMDASILDAVFKTGASTFTMALDSGLMTQNAHFYGTSDVSQATIGIYWSCKPGWSMDTNGQCTVATPLPPVEAPIAPPTTPPVDPPMTEPMTAPTSDPVPSPIILTPSTNAPTTLEAPITVEVPTSVETPITLEVPTSVETPIALSPADGGNAPLSRPVSRSDLKSVSSSIFLPLHVLLAMTLLQFV